jgi:methylamine methyltransferase corrinoid activation protein
MTQAISLDLGTSGIRGQLLDLSKKKVLRTCICSRNPLPGANVMDHLSFAIEQGPDLAHDILLCAIEQVIDALAPKDLERIAVCGNPIQISIFEGIEIRDLAYAGKNLLEEAGVIVPDRRGHIARSDTVGLGREVDVVIPPSVRHEVGADALAMMIKSGFLDDDMCMVTDYGTNAEMALKVGDDIYSGSAAAGPAMEGQHIQAGMLASPGAISDLVQVPEGWRVMVLDETFEPQAGSVVSLRGDTCKSQGLRARGITGTGVVALIYAGMKCGRIDPPHISGGDIRLEKGIKFTEPDLIEAGKAIGAIRAGHLTLLQEAGIGPDELLSMYMAGASGTYVDALKARAVGLVPAGARSIMQIGNTSLELAKDLAFEPDLLDDLNEMRKNLISRHVMFASSPAFSDLYVQELAYWTEGMPWDRYQRNLAALGVPVSISSDVRVAVERRHRIDIWDIGDSLCMIEPNVHLEGKWECTRCLRCVQACPEEALSLSMSDNHFTVDTGKCLGTACRRCEEACPDQVFSYDRLVLGEEVSRTRHDARLP